MTKHIFTITAGCAPVGDVMIESFLKHHPEEHIHRYCFSDDINMYGDLSKRVTTHILPESFKEFFLKGHEGTAKVWSRIIKANPDVYLIQVDSDVVFKRESISLIEKQNYPDLYGSRRCYENNPVGIPVAKGTEDSLSTYFIGFNPKFLGSLLKDSVLESNLERMIQGVYNPLGFPVFDFFDPCFFYMRSQGATVYYEDVEIIGGQNSEGKKINSFKSNLHLDMGSHLAHFGGVGSGYMASKDDSKMNKSYSDWAKHRCDLFNAIFYRHIVIEDEPTQHDSLGRWVAGPYDGFIFNDVLFDLRSENIDKAYMPAINMSSFDQDYINSPSKESKQEDAI